MSRADISLGSLSATFCKQEIEATHCVMRPCRWTSKIFHQSAQAQMPQKNQTKMCPWIHATLVEVVPCAMTGQLKPVCLIWSDLMCFLCLRWVVYTASLCLHLKEPLLEVFHDMMLIKYWLCLCMNNVRTRLFNADLANDCTHASLLQLSLHVFQSC